MIWAMVARWLGLEMVATVSVMLALGCGDDSSHPYSDDHGDDTQGQPPPPMVDYSGCDRTMQDADCVGMECGLTPQAQDYLQVMIEVVDDAGYGDELTPTKAEYFPLTNELSIDYQLQVGWFRVASSIALAVLDSDEILRQELAAHVSGWDLPSQVASPAQISAAVEGCSGLLSYEHCTDNQLDFVAHDRYDWEQPDGCVYKTTYAVVSAATASVLECVVEQEQACD